MNTRKDVDTCFWYKRRLFGGAGLAVVLAIAGACTHSIATQQKVEYRYVGVDSGRALTFNLLKQEVDNGHRISSVRSCGAPKFQICLQGDVTLAIPRGDLKKGDTWEVAGTRFLVASVDAKQTTEYLIVSGPPDKGVNIFFNGVNGIWGFQLSAGGEIYKSTDPCGLGCSISPSK